MEATFGNVQKTGKIAPNNYVISSTFLSGIGNLNLPMSYMTLQLWQIIVLIEKLCVSPPLSQQDEKVYAVFQ